MITVAQMEHHQLVAVARLFDLYRQFYDQSPNFDDCHSYLAARTERKESIIFVAWDQQRDAVGFTQLYDSFCSVALRPITYLYDLYVADSMRRRGVAKQLMQAAKQYAQQRHAERLTLETHHSNSSAQRLYESLGYVRDEQFQTYHLELTNEA